MAYHRYHGNLAVTGFHTYLSAGKTKNAHSDIDGERVCCTAHFAGKHLNRKETCVSEYVRCKNSLYTMYILY